MMLSHSREKFVMSDIKSVRPRYRILRNGWDKTAIYIKGPIENGGRHVKKVFKTISSKSSKLRHIWIDVSYHGFLRHTISASQLCYLLSCGEKIETLVVALGGVELKNEQDVERLTQTLSKCKSLRNVAFDELVIHCRDVPSVAPLMKALSELPLLTNLYLNIVANREEEQEQYFGLQCWDEEQSDRYAKESLPILQEAPRLVDFVEIENPQGLGWMLHGGKEQQHKRKLSNCDYTDFYFIRYDTSMAYDELNEASSLLELALWKLEMEKSSENGATDHHDRAFHRNNCGAEIVVKGVLRYLVPSTISKPRGIGR